MPFREDTSGRDLVAFPDIITFECKVTERYVDSSICRYWSIDNPHMFLDTLTKPFRVFVTSRMRLCQDVARWQVTKIFFSFLGTCGYDLSKACFVQGWMKNVLIVRNNNIQCFIGLCHKLLGRQEADNLAPVTVGGPWLEIQIHSIHGQIFGHNGMCRKSA